MSVQRNQYLIYGHLLAKDFINLDGDAFYERFEKFMDDSAFTAEIKHHDGIFLLQSGMGKYMIVGRVLEKSSNGECIADEEPMTLPELTDLEIEFIENSIRRNFEVEPDCDFYFITHYR